MGEKDMRLVVHDESAGQHYKTPTDIPLNKEGMNEISYCKGIRFENAAFLEEKMTLI